MRQPRSWGDLRLRALSAIVLAPLALTMVWLGAVPWDAAVAAVAAGLALEWTALCGMSARRWPGVLLPGAVVIGAVLAALGFAGVAIAWLAAAAALIALASGRLSCGLGAPYVGAGAVALLWLRQGASGRADVLLLVLLVWASDIGAYCAGRLLGGPRLAPAISPAKTWAGAVGGLAAAVAVGWAAAAVTGVPVGKAAGAAMVLGVATQAGDLLESWIKRQFGVKDSGRLIPGHGGLLDRLDGLLAAAPAAAMLAFILGRGRLWWM